MGKKKKYIDYDAEREAASDFVDRVLSGEITPEEIDREYHHDKYENEGYDDILSNALRSVINPDGTLKRSDAVVKDIDIDDNDDDEAEDDYESNYAVSSISDIFDISDDSSYQENYRNKKKEKEKTNEIIKDVLNGNIEKELAEEDDEDDSDTEEENVSVNPEKYGEVEYEDDETEDKSSFPSIPSIGSYYASFIDTIHITDGIIPVSVNILHAIKHGFETIDFDKLNERYPNEYDFFSVENDLMKALAVSRFPSFVARKEDVYKAFESIEEFNKNKFKLFNYKDYIFGYLIDEEFMDNIILIGDHYAKAYLKNTDGSSDELSSLTKEYVLALITEAMNVSNDPNHIFNFMDENILNGLIIARDNLEKFADKVANDEDTVIGKSKFDYFIDYKHIRSTWYGFKRTFVSEGDLKEEPEDEPMKDRVSEEELEDEIKEYDEKDDFDEDYDDENDEVIVDTPSNASEDEDEEEPKKEKMVEYEDEEPKSSFEVIHTVKKEADDIISENERVVEEEEEIGEEEKEDNTVENEDDTTDINSLADSIEEEERENKEEPEEQNKIDVVGSNDSNSSGKMVLPVFHRN
jgi:hypothetical protein